MQIMNADIPEAFSGSGDFTFSGFYCEYRDRNQEWIRKPIYFVAEGVSEWDTASSEWQLALGFRFCLSYIKVLPEMEPAMGKVLSDQHSIQARIEFHRQHPDESEFVMGRIVKGQRNLCVENLKIRFETK